MVKGHQYQYQIFLDSGPVASERVLVFKFQLCPGGRVRGETLVPGAAVVKVLSSVHALAHDVQFRSTFSEKRFSISLNRIGQF